MTDDQPRAEDWVCEGCGRENVALCKCMSHRLCGDCHRAAPPALPPSDQWAPTVADVDGRIVVAWPGLTDTLAEHEWLWHQPPDASRAPVVGTCSCGAVDFDHIASWAEDRAKTNAWTVLAQLTPDRVYAVRIPDGHTVLDLTEELRQIEDATGIRLVVFQDGITVSEIEGQAVELLRAEIERLRIVETASIGAHALLDDANAEIERLRGLVGEALDGWETAGTWSEIDSTGRHKDIARIRREAGLT